jgi:hypothetical protein
MALRGSLLVIVALLLAGCTGDEPPATATESEATTTSATPQVEGAATASVSWVSPVAETALLTDVRVAAHTGFDRIVFEFENGIPGYDVGYAQRPILADGSGAEVAVAGGAVLVVRMEPALDADLTQETAPRTYTGPTRLAPNVGVITELVRTGGFEAVLTWAAGVVEKRPFRVERLDNPARIVIDVETA